MQWKYRISVCFMYSFEKRYRCTSQPVGFTDVHNAYQLVERLQLSGRPSIRRIRGSIPASSSPCPRARHLTPNCSRRLCYECLANPDGQVAPCMVAPPISVRMCVNDDMKCQGPFTITVWHLDELFASFNLG